MKWGLDEQLAVWQVLGVQGTPTVITFDADGRVVAGWSGERGEAFMREQIEALLAAP